MPAIFRGLTACVAAILLTASCAGDTDITETRTVPGFAGIVAADEPRAALVGREVLGRNGTAADAAVAMGFAMTVTMPSRVGLGGGGACVVHDRESKTTEALLFLPQPAESGNGVVPGTARGLAALHARYGVRDWRLLMTPAEQLARFGHVVSRAFHRDLADGAQALGPEVKARFLRADGGVPEVGARLRHEALSATLSGLRQQGAGYIYAGPFARRLAEATEAANAPVRLPELGAYRARFVESLKVPFGAHHLHLPPPPVLGGLAAGQLWGMLAQSPGDSAEMTPRGAHFLAEAWKRALSGRRAWARTPAADRPDPQDLVEEDELERMLATSDPGAATPAARLTPPPDDMAAGVPTAGFAVADRLGNMVACDFTMNGLFGSGREAGSTGVLLARRADTEVAGAAVAPAVLANRHTGTGYLAVSAADGIAGQSALGELMRKLNAVGAARTNPAPIDLARLLAMPRLHHRGQPDELLVEPDLPAPVLERLRTSGHSLVKASGLGRLQAVYCPYGADSVPEACQSAADPRGAGLAVRAQ